MSVLLIVLMLSVISVSMGKYYFLSSKREGYVDFQIDAIQYMNNIETLAIREVRKQFRFNKTYTSKNQVLFRDPIYLQLEKGSLKTTINDASACFNINSLLSYTKEEFTPNQKAIDAFQQYLKYLGFDSASIDAITDQIIDWVDSDNEPRPNGLEDYFYTGPMNDSKQFTSKRYFYHISEIRNLPAISYFDWNIVKKNFCVLPNEDNYSININFLDTSHLYLLASVIPDLSLSSSEEILSSIPTDGFNSLSDLQTSFPKVTFDNPNIPISFFSQLLYLNTHISYEDFDATSKTLMNYNKNELSIISRSYNGL